MKIITALLLTLTLLSNASCEKRYICKCGGSGQRFKFEAEDDEVAKHYCDSFEIENGGDSKSCKIIY